MIEVRKATIEDFDAFKTLDAKWENDWIYGRTTDFNKKRVKTCSLSLCEEDWATILSEVDMTLAKFEAAINKNYAYMIEDNGNIIGAVIFFFKDRSYFRVNYWPIAVKDPEHRIKKEVIKQLRRILRSHGKGLSIACIGNDGLLRNLGFVSHRSTFYYLNFENSESL